MARQRTEGDIVLDFRNKDFSTMTEKGVPDCSSQPKPLKLLELFGGIGAPRRALQNLGYNIKSIDYVEVLPCAVLAYNNIFECGPDAQDIRMWNLSPDLVVHGSPCQDWSNEGSNNINTGRSILFERVLQILDPEPEDGHPELSRQPKVILWENVPRLLWKYEDVLNYYIDVLDEFGYTSYYQILTASDYNIPQDRDRIFVVSILNNIPGANSFTFPDKVEQTLQLRDLIDQTVSFDDPEVQLTESEQAILSRLEDGTLTVREGTKKGYKEIAEWQIVNLAIPGSKNRRGRVGNNAKTITTLPRQAIYYNNQIRMLTAKEYLLLMGYEEEDYQKMHNAGITDKQIRLLAGNSICVPVLMAIFNRLQELGTICSAEETK